MSESSLDSELLAAAKGGKKRKAAASESEYEASEASDESVSLDDEESDWEAARTTRHA